MKTYTLSWVAILIIGAAIMVFKDLAPFLGLALIIISIISLLKKKDKVEINIDTNKN